MLRGAGSPALAGWNKPLTAHPFLFCLAPFFRQVGASDGWAPAPRLTLAYPALLGACLIDPALLLASLASFHLNPLSPATPFLRPTTALLRAGSSRVGLQPHDNGVGVGLLKG